MGWCLHNEIAMLYAIPWYPASNKMEGITAELLLLKWLNRIA